MSDMSPVDQAQIACRLYHVMPFFLGFRLRTAFLSLVRRTMQGFMKWRELGAFSDPSYVEIFFIKVRSLISSALWQRP